MKNIKYKKVVVVLLFLGTLSLVASAAGVWSYLGTRSVNWGLDHDRIINTQPGAFSKLKINVAGNLNMHKVVVNYGNGSSQQLNVRHNFRRGSDSRIIDLDGNKRKIKSIDFWYDTKNASRRKAKVSVFARR